MIFRLVLISLFLLPISLVQANEAGEKDFPTLARVEYVLACMKKHGKENYDTLYGCVCAIDHIRSQFDYDEYNEAYAFLQLRSTAGETGALFRDPEQADQLRDKLEEVNKAAEKNCFYKAVSAKP
jgi:hypothetical protein